MLRSLYAGAAFATRRILLTGSGADRLGIIKDVASVVVSEGGNIRESCMSKLAGDFALMMLLDVPESRFASLQLKLYKHPALTDLGLSIRDVHEEAKDAKDFYYTVKLVLTGLDNPGIVHHFSNFLAYSSINVLNLFTYFHDTSQGRNFTLKAYIKVPKLINFEDLDRKMMELAVQDGLNVKVTETRSAEELYEI